MTLRLTRLDGNLRIATDGGLPSSQFLRLFNNAMKSIEDNDAAQQETIDALAAQLELITAAQASATAAARETARISSYPSPADVLSAADVGSDCTITVATHTRVYPVQGTIDVPDVVISPGTVTGLAFSTVYYVYYDDTTLAASSPTFHATTTAATAQVGAAAGRHNVGKVTTPADGGGGTSGGGYQAPGGAIP